MKAALIPPIPHLKQFGHGPLHLLLAHLLKHPKHTQYKNHYKEERKHGAYLILDNSAHEKGEGEDPEELMIRALEMNAQEVVVPDVLDDGPATVEACVAAHEVWYEGHYAGMQMLDPALMYVPQGKDLEEWVECFHQLVSIQGFASRRFGIRRDFVLGVSKDYEVWEGGIELLLDNHVWPMKILLDGHGIKMHVHLLGWGRDLWRLEYLSQQFPWIRSTDSAKPFVYALSDIELQPPDIPTYPLRPKSYFQKNLTERQIEIARNNVWTFRAAAQGDLAGTVLEQ